MLSRAGNPDMPEPLALGWGVVALAGMGKVAAVVGAGYAVGSLALWAFDAAGVAGAITIIGTVAVGLVIELRRRWLATDKETDHAEMIRLRGEVKRLTSEVKRLSSELVSTNSLSASIARLRLMDAGFAPKEPLPDPDGREAP